MKKTLLLLVLALGLFGVPSRAQAWFHVHPYRVDAGFKIWFNIQPLGPQVQLAPWYTYFPYEAHFQTPAPMGYYPQWPNAPAAGMYQPPQPQFAPHAPSPVRPASYYYSPAPSYWYGR